MIDVAVRDGEEAPVLVCRLPVGERQPCAVLTGNALTIDVKLPQTLAVAATGRRLGEIVATGIPMLDDRRVARVVPTKGRTRFVLDPDLITIGEARRAMERSREGNVAAASVNDAAAARQLRRHGNGGTDPDPRALTDGIPPGSTTTLNPKRRRLAWTTQTTTGNLRTR